MHKQGTSLRVIRCLLLELTIYMGTLAMDAHRLQGVARRMHLAGGSLSALCPPSHARSPAAPMTTLQSHCSSSHRTTAHECDFTASAEEVGIRQNLGQTVLLKQAL